MKGSITLDKIVLDTNNIISLFLKGNFQFLSHLKYRYSIEVCTCDIQLNELREVMIRSDNYFSKHLKLPVSDYINFFLAHSILYNVNPRYDGLHDLKDNYLIDTAYTAKAYYIVSGDRQVLAKKHVKRIQIISITQLNHMLRER